MASRVELLVYLKASDLKWALFFGALSVKENMKGVAILSLMVILGAGDASPQGSSSSQGERLGAIPFPGVGGNNGKPKFENSDRGFELKCENERGICKGHCDFLGYAGGGCIDDFCYCYSGYHTTFECDRIITVGGKAISEKHKSCKTVCQLLRKDFEEGECTGGKCHCRKQSDIQKINETFAAPTSYWQQAYRR